MGKVVEPTFATQTGYLSDAKLRLATGHVVSRHLRNLALLESHATFRGRQVPANLAEDAVDDADQPPTTASATAPAGCSSMRRPEYEARRPAVGADPDQVDTRGDRCLLGKRLDDRCSLTNAQADQSDMSVDDDDDAVVEPPKHDYDLRKRPLSRGKRSRHKKRK